MASTLSVLTRLHKLFIHRYGIAIVVLIATMRKPMYFLHWWTYFNLAMSVFFIYVLTIRDEIKQQCEDSFWSSESDENIMKEYIQEYACVVDQRFFEPNSIVYAYLLWNVVLTPLLLYFLLHADRKIKYILALQLIPAVIYHATKSWKFVISLKSVLYTIVSLLWVVYPASLLISLRNK